MTLQGNQGWGAGDRLPEVGVEGGVAERTPGGAVSAERRWLAGRAPAPGARRPRPGPAQASRSRGGCCRSLRKPRPATPSDRLLSASDRGRSLDSPSARRQTAAGSPEFSLRPGEPGSGPPRPCARCTCPTPATRSPAGTARLL